MALKTKKVFRNGAEETYYLMDYRCSCGEQLVATAPDTGLCLECGEEYLFLVGSGVGEFLIEE